MKTEDEEARKCIQRLRLEEGDEIMGYQFAHEVEAARGYLRVVGCFVCIALSVKHSTHTLETIPDLWTLTVPRFDKHEHQLKESG